MPQPAAVIEHDHGLQYNFLFEELPHGPQATICSLAQTPSCPAHVRLAAVSRCWSAAAVQHLPATGASISLSLACSGSSSTEAKQREEERLMSLSAWLRRNGHTVGSLCLDPGELRQAQEYVPGRGPGVLVIVEALAAAGASSQGLRLQQLRLPAMGCATPSSIATALSGCQHLRHLQLDYTYSAEAMEPHEYSQGRLPAALQQLTQLTCLKLNLGGFRHAPAAGAASRRHVVSMAHLFCCLPSSLVDLEVAELPNRCFHMALDLPYASLQHMVALRRLILPHQVTFRSGSFGDQLAPLTSVTYLDYCDAFCYHKKLLRGLPNLAELCAGLAFGVDDCTVLTTLQALRSLACQLDFTDESAAVLAQLTQLTGLTMWLEVEGLERPVDHPLAAYGHAVASLPHLCRLTIEPEVLEQTDVAALTALTRLGLGMQGEERAEWYTPERRQQLLQGLAPARGWLREVHLLGLDASLHELYRAGLAATLGDVHVVFAATCSRPVWCNCCVRAGGLPGV